MNERPDPVSKSSVIVSAGKGADKKGPRITGSPTNPVLSFINDFNRLSPAEQKRQLPALTTIYVELLKSTVRMTKSQWEERSVDQQAEAIRFLEFAFESQGLPKSDTYGLSLFLGPFMQSAPPQATLEDGIVQYFQQLRRRKTDQAASDLLKVLSAFQIGAEIMDSLGRSSQ